jgi:hypothetical protein
MMKNLWLAAALAVSITLGGLSMTQAQAGHGHHGGCGYGGYNAGYGGYTAGYGGYVPAYGGYRSGYGVYGPSRVVVGRVYTGGPYYGGGFSPYYGSRYSPYYGGLGTGLGVGVYGSGYRGLGYSNFGVGPSIRFGSPFGVPFGSFRF